MKFNHFLLWPKSYLQFLHHYFYPKIHQNSYLHPTNQDLHQFHHHFLQLIFYYLYFNTLGSWNRLAQKFHSLYWYKLHILKMHQALSWSFSLSNKHPLVTNLFQNWTKEAYQSPYHTTPWISFNRISAKVQLLS